MKKSILCIGILFISTSIKSQVVWNQGFVQSLEEFFFIPVEFENFGNWLAGIEKDSSLVFKEKEFTIDGDSLNMNFDLEKPEFPSHFIKSSHSLIVYGKTYTLNNLNEISKDRPGSLSFKPLPSRKITTVYIISKFSFAPSEEGKLLAAEAMDSLELKFSRYFKNKKVIKSPKDIKKRKYHPEMEKQVTFYMKNNPNPSFWMNNATFPDRNEVSIYINYDLN